ncbi:MAG: glycosyltransferase family 8 protein [Puniceicoccales bacterium]|jgi:lipopolysaccharide biosynthesis glycosyltransferase|nr:glycosyltransferase family 8 protein [Puniceicoccales bacterium]
MGNFAKKLLIFLGLLVLLVFLWQIFPVTSRDGTNRGTSDIMSRNKTVIPIILSSDNNYAPQMYVAMLSVLKNAHRDTFYQFYLLISPNFDKKYREEILELGKKYICSIDFINMGEAFFNVLPGPYPPVVYYRLMAADLLPDCEKCLYMDVDVVVFDDLGELYNTDLKDCYIAGVRDAWIFSRNPKERSEQISSILNIDAHECINSGVVLMNLALIRRDGLAEKLISVAKHGIDGKKPFPYPDQDTLNKVCCGRIKFLDLKYNTYACIFPELEQLQKFWKPAEVFFGKKQFAEACKHPCIIHFIGTKPWANPAALHANLWWKYARQTPFYEEILYKQVAKNACQDYGKILPERIRNGVRNQLQEQLKKM